MFRVLKIRQQTDASRTIFELAQLQNTNGECRFLVEKTWDFKHKNSIRNVKMKKKKYIEKFCNTMYCIYIFTKNHLNL